MLVIMIYKSRQCNFILLLSKIKSLVVARMNLTTKEISLSLGFKDKN